MLNNDKSNKINKLKELVAAVVVVKIKKLIKKFHTTIRRIFMLIALKQNSTHHN